MGTEVSVLSLLLVQGLESDSEDEGEKPSEFARGAPLTSATPSSASTEPPRAPHTLSHSFRRPRMPRAPWCVTHDGSGSVREVLKTSRDHHTPCGTHRGRYPVAETARVMSSTGSHAPRCSSQGKRRDVRDHLRDKMSLMSCTADVSETDLILAISPVDKSSWMVPSLPSIMTRPSFVRPPASAS